MADARAFLLRFLILITPAWSMASSAELAKESDCMSTGQHISLKPNEAIVIQSVNPKCKYFPTSLNIKPGETYALTSQGRWKDGGISTGPMGWNGIIANFLNRVPGRNFFYLCGSIGTTDKTSFPIGRQREWSVPSDLTTSNASLYLFPNDWNGQWFRNNNSALDETPLQVTIRRLK